MGPTGPRCSAASGLGPTPLDHLAAPGDGEGVRWNVLHDTRARGDVRALSHSDRRYELDVASDERSVTHDRLVLLDAVVIAGDGPRAHVRSSSDHRVPEVGEVRRLGAGTEPGIFELDEVPHFRPGTDVRVRAKVGEGSNLHVLSDPARADEAVVEHRRARAYARIHDVAEASDRRVASDDRRSLEMHPGEELRPI